jgi:molybdopterin/thiamine biosynthesis adenylyltransferase
MRLTRRTCEVRIRRKQVTQSNQDCYRQAVPFVEGDVIQFSVMIHAQQDQHNLTGVPEIVEPITCL